jgi:AcrR family transcriptional regulator
MSDSVLTPERILDVAEEVLRRFGLAKATVVDVAHVLGVSHGTVYRHFASKAALRDAVTERWLARVSDPLEALANGDSPASERLNQWMLALIHAKRSRAHDDPELFATYMSLVAESREVVQAHVEHLVEHLTRIVSDGVAEGVFSTPAPALTARAIIDATGRFHNPAHAIEWASPTIDQEFEAVWKLVRRGIEA